jgi:hypothetical protein
MRFVVHTTCHLSGWQQYGRRMVESFDQFWPIDIPLYLYAENFQPDHHRPIVQMLPAWLAEFKARHAAHPYAHGMIDGKYDFHFDCVRFAHKVAAMTEAAAKLEADILIWVDADIVTHAPVDTNWLKSLFPEGPYIAWLDRFRHYPEGGFYMMRCSHPAHRTIMARWQQLYETDAVLELAQTQDAWALQHIIHQAERQGLVTTHSLSGEAYRLHRHPLINGPLGKCLDHLKGDARKVMGRSPPTDLMTPRSEDYWVQS